VKKKRWEEKEDSGEGGLAWLEVAVSQRRHSQVVEEEKRRKKEKKERKERRKREQGREKRRGGPADWSATVCC